MEQQPCITDRLWTGYSNKTLSPAETGMILDHVASCEVCTDIKEGIDALSKPEALAQNVGSINKRVDEYFKPKRNLSVFWYWSAAAVLIFAIGLSWFYINNEKTIAYSSKDSVNIINPPIVKPEIPNETSPVIKSPELKEIPMANNANPVFQPEGRFDSKEDLRKKSDDYYSDDLSEKTMDDAIQFKDMESKNLTDTSKLLIAADTLSRGNTWAYGAGANNVNTTFSNSPSAPANMSSMEAPDFTVKQTAPVSYSWVESSSSTKKKAETVTRKSAANPAPMNNSNNINNSLTDNYSLSKIFYITDSSNLAQAQRNYDLNNYAKCIENLKTISSNPSSLYYEEGLFLKAKALIKQNKNKDAKTVLNTLIALNGVRKMEAETLLKGLK